MTVDNTAIINRIIAILEDNVPLAAQIRSFRFGEDNNEVHDGPFPYILVTTPNRLITNRDSFGVGDGAADNQNIVQYQIMGFVDGNKSKTAETLKYDLLKKVHEVLVANPRLKDPVTTLDPLCIRSSIITTDNRPDTRGKENQGFVITLQCQIGSAYQVILPGPFTLDLLSIPNSLDGFEFDQNLTDDQKRYVDTTNDIGTFLLQYEDTSANEAIIFPLLGTIGNITLIKPSGSRIVQVSFITRNSTAPFDEIARSILHLEKTN